MAIFADIWNYLRSNPAPQSTATISHNINYPMGRVRTALTTIEKSGLITDHEGLGFYINSKFLGVALHDARPRRINDGEWGCMVDAPKGMAVQKGDLVVITTQKGLVFDPATISEISKVYPKLDRVHHICKSSKGVGQCSPNLPDAPMGAGQENLDGENEGNGEGELMADEGKQPEPQQEKNAPEQQPHLTKKQMRQAMEDLNKLIQEKVEEEVAKRVQPVAIEVKAPDAPAVKLEGTHYLFPRLLRLVNAGFNVFMWGPPGTGKTTAAMHVAKALSRKAEIDTLDPTTARSMVQGYMTPTGNPVHNVFTRCWENGSVYIADEVDLAPGHVQTLFNSALANGHAPLAWGNVEQAEGFSFVATGNTAGRPTAAFPDRRPMSNAFADRLYFLYWPLDPAIECRAVGLKAPAVPKEDREKCDPKAWVTFVRKLRAWAEDNAPTLSITPRASLLGVKALAAGEAPNNVADGLIFRGCDPDLKSKALRNVRW